VTKDKEAVQKARQYSGNVDLVVRELTPTLPQLYDYLHASDALIYNKPSLPHVTVSSTVFQCLGSGCPIISRESTFIETLHSEVLRFNDKKDFMDCLEAVLEDGKRCDETVSKAKQYVEKNSAELVAARFIDLFEYLK
jgi:hypothetical protein